MHSHNIFSKGAFIMNKKELVAATAEATGMPQKCVEAILKAFMANVVAEIAQKGKVQLIGFGTFEARARAARTGMNPQTGKPIKIAAATVPAFKPGKAFKEAVNAKPAKKKAAKKAKK
jgi:DNA-binding protein HU-beta